MPGWCGGCQPGPGLLPPPRPVCGTGPRCPQGGGRQGPGTCWKLLSYSVRESPPSQARPHASPKATGERMATSAIMTVRGPRHLPAQPAWHRGVQFSETRCNTFSFPGLTPTAAGAAYHLLAPTPPRRPHLFPAHTMLSKPQCLLKRDSACELCPDGVQYRGVRWARRLSWVSGRPLFSHAPGAGALAAATPTAGSP